MRRSKSLWQANRPLAGLLARPLATLALMLALACEGTPQSRGGRPAPPRRKGRPTPAQPMALTVDTVPFQLMRMSWFVLPGQRLDIGAGLGPALVEARAKAAVGRLDTLAPGHWTYTAPARPGQDMIAFSQQGGPAKAWLRICVMIPQTELRRGRLRGYQIGTYITRHPNPIYSPPLGYFEVLGKSAGEWLTDHVRMSDVVTKQQTAYPRYLVLNPRLLVKLETALAQAQRAGIKVRRWSFISGYRTPYYNAKIENVGLSRHQYGDAADVFVDNDNDGYMDDLDGNGKLDIRDAEYLARVVDKMDQSPRYSHLSGGLGIYAPKGTRTPFIHMDTRGHKARWRN